MLICVLQGVAPTISIDNTAGCQLYLSKDSLESSITTAKSSEVNVLVPASEAEGDWVCFVFSIWPYITITNACMQFKNIIF